jgi:nicotinamidase-related amidase
MNNTILLVVDVQNALIEANPYNKEKVIQNIKKLITAAKENNREVIYVRHNDGAGEELEYGSKGWQIYPEVSPIGDETIFEKQYCSSFRQTGLHEYLSHNKTENIILVGLQTEYCIDTTCKVAFELGYKVIVPEETNTTFSNEFLPAEKLYEFYNYKIWDKRFASVKPLEEVLELLRQ